MSKKCVSILLALIMALAFRMPSAAAAAASPDAKSLTPYDLSVKETTGPNASYGSVLLTFKIKGLDADFRSVSPVVIIEMKYGDSSWDPVGDYLAEEIISKNKVGPDTYAIPVYWTANSKWDGVTVLSYRVFVHLEDFTFGMDYGDSGYSNVATIGGQKAPPQNSPSPPTPPTQQSPPPTQPTQQSPPPTQPSPPTEPSSTQFQANSWAIPELTKAQSKGLIPNSLRNADLTKSITRAEFAAVGVKLYEALSQKTANPAPANTFKDTQDTDVLKAYALDIVAGMDGGRYEPNVLLSREQAAAMLARVYKKIKWEDWNLQNDSSYTKHSLDNKDVNKFADDANISEWAKPSVYFMVKYEIIVGIDKTRNLFAPKNTNSAEEAKGYANATREQALAISIRMFEKFNEIKDGGPVTPKPATPTDKPAPPTAPPTDKPAASPTPASQPTAPQQPTEPQKPDEPSPPAGGTGTPGEKPSPPTQPSR